MSTASGVWGHSSFDVRFFLRSCPFALLQHIYRATAATATPALHACHLLGGWADGAQKAFGSWWRVVGGGGRRWVAMLQVCPIQAWRHGHNAPAAVAVNGLAISHRASRGCCTHAIRWLLRLAFICHLVPPLRPPGCGLDQGRNTNTLLLIPPGNAADGQELAKPMSVLQNC